MDVLAHQGGWDEILLVALPLLILAGLLKLANTRAKQQAQELAAQSVGAEGSGADDQS